MEALDIARWQFGITTVYHFMLVPLTLGLGMAIVIMQTIWVRTGDERFLRMVKFWGKLYLINFILGVATGLVQEFQFGMAWSEYSRFVGDVFGAPPGPRGPACILRRVDVLGNLDLRMGSPAKESAPCGALVRGDRLVVLGVLHHRRELVDAAPGRRRAGRRQARHERHLGSTDQQHRARRVHPTRSSVRWSSRACS